MLLSLVIQSFAPHLFQTLLVQDLVSLYSEDSYESYVSMYLCILRILRACSISLHCIVLWIYGTLNKFQFQSPQSISDSASGITGPTCVSPASTANCSLGTPATNSPIISSTSDRPKTGTYYTTAPREIRINVNKPTNERLSALQARSAKPPK